MAKGIKSSKGRICYTEHLTQASTSFGFMSEVPVAIVSDLCTGGNFAEWGGNENHVPPLFICPFVLFFWLLLF